MGVTIAAIIAFVVVVIILARVSSRQPPVPVKNVTSPDEPLGTGSRAPYSRNGSGSNGHTTLAATSSSTTIASSNESMAWTKRFDPTGTALDESARLALLGDLAVVRAPWAMLLAQQAYNEERSIVVRRAALRALAAYRHADTRPTFEAALDSDDAELRAIALIGIDALDERSTDSA